MKPCSRFTNFVLFSTLGSNAYFGVWGSFFNSVFLFGTWLKENKNIDYFVRESNDEESAEP
jgi:hypothetical protein